MRNAILSIPELGLIAGTRGMLGAGLGLLLADRMSPEARRAVGWTLIAVGAVTTVPLIAGVLTHLTEEPRDGLARLSGDSRRRNNKATAGVD